MVVFNIARLQQQNSNLLSVMTKDLLLPGYDVAKIIMFMWVPMHY